MVPLVGGPAHADSLVPLLEKLAREEETVVRDAAVQSLSKVAGSFTTEQALEHLVPCVRVWAPLSVCQPNETLPGTGSSTQYC